MESPTKTLQILVIEDEPKSLKLLCKLIEDHYPFANIIGVAKSYEEAYDKILNLKPNLLLLDINLPPYTSFDLLKQLPNLNFEVIFITDIAEYAIRAFKFSAIDFILKPVLVEELLPALETAEKRLQEKKEFNRLKQMLINLEHPTSNDNKIVLPSLKGREMEISIKNIIHCESDGEVTYFYLSNKDKERIVANKGIGECADLLKEYGFCRIHRQYLVNMEYINKEFSFSGTALQLLDGTSLPLARRRRAEFLERYKKYKL